MKRILLSEKIKKAPPFLTIEPYLRPQDKPVASHPEAREPRLVPLVVIDYGSLAARIKQMRYIGRLLFGAVGEMWKSARSIRQNPYCVIRAMPITESGASRSPISAHGDHLIRAMPITGQA